MRLFRSLPPPPEFDFLVYIPGKLGYSPLFSLSIPLFLSTSVQLYLYWRQARHYAIQFPLSLCYLYGYLNLQKPRGIIMFLIFGVLLYHAYYPVFFSFTAAIAIHAAVRKVFDKKYNLRPLIFSRLALAAVNAPAFYLRQLRPTAKQRLPQNPLAAYLSDLNYFGYFKIVISYLYFYWWCYGARPCLRGAGPYKIFSAPTVTRFLYFQW